MHAPDLSEQILQENAVSNDSNTGFGSGSKPTQELYSTALAGLIILLSANMKRSAHS
jgi:hypothetical protein